MSDDSKKRKFVTELPKREDESKSVPDISSRRLSYSTSFQKEKENAKSSSLNQRVKQPNQPTRKESLPSSAPPRKAARTNTCCLCSKAGGMILKCQCDNINCNERAHAICIQNFRKGKAGKTILCQEAA